MMALPDWAYAQRQQLSPVVVQGTVMTVSCSEHDCLLTLSLEQVIRNQTDVRLQPGDVLTVRVEAAAPAQVAAPSGAPRPSLLGKPGTVRLPELGSHTTAWLRPAPYDERPQNELLFDLLAGPYGFGPSLEHLLQNPQP